MLEVLEVFSMKLGGIGGILLIICSTFTESTPSTPSKYMSIVHAKMFDRQNGGDWETNLYTEKTYADARYNASSQTPGMPSSLL